MERRSLGLRRANGEVKKKKKAGTPAKVWSLFVAPFYYFGKLHYVQNGCLKRKCLTKVQKEICCMKGTIYEGLMVVLVIVWSVIYSLGFELR